MSTVWSLMEAVLQFIVVCLQSAFVTLRGVNSLLWTAVKKCITIPTEDAGLKVWTKGRFLLDDFKVTYLSSLVQGRLNTFNAELLGMDTFSVQSLRFDLSDPKCLELNCSLSLDELTLHCDFRFSGKLASFSLLDYLGHAKALLRDVKIDLKLTGCLQKVDGKEYIHVEKMKMNPTISHFQFKFREPSNQQAGNHAFRVTLNNFIWQRLYDMLFLHVEKHIGQLVIEYIHKFTLRVPFVDIFVLNR